MLEVTQPKSAPRDQIHTQASILSLENVTVSFDGFKAVDNLSFSVPKGTVRVVIGPNGAGKSTMCDAVIGKVRPASGRVLFNGQDISKLSEHAIARLGICRKFQTPGVLENLTVLENLAVAVRKDKAWWNNLRPGLRSTETARVTELLELIDLTEKQNMLAAQLAHGEKQWLEIGMVVAADPELLLLDEPTEGIQPSIVLEIEAALTRVRKELSVAVLLVEQYFEFAWSFADRFFVMQKGRIIDKGHTNERSAESVEALLGV